MKFPSNINLSAGRVTHTKNKFKNQYFFVTNIFYASKTILWHHNKSPIGWKFVKTCNLSVDPGKLIRLQGSPFKQLKILLFWTCYLQEP